MSSEREQAAQPFQPKDGDKVLIEAEVLESANEHGRVFVRCDTDEEFYVNATTIHRALDELESLVIVQRIGKRKPWRRLRLWLSGRCFVCGHKKLLWGYMSGTMACPWHDLI